MFGNNDKAPVLHKGSGTMLPVREVFYTLQGEGPHSGRPAVFLRLGGCNLACWFCDTDFDLAKSPMTGVEKVAEQILGQLAEVWGVRGFCPMLVITGGEPLLYNLAPLIGLLRSKSADLRIQIETAGSTIGRDTAECIAAYKVEVVCSPKTGKVHPLMSRLVTAWKYVLRSGEVDTADGLPVGSMQREGDDEVIARPTNNAPVYVQPCDEHVMQMITLHDEVSNEANRAEVRASALRHGHRASIQLHKLLELE